MAPNGRVRYFVELVNSEASQSAVARATWTNSAKTHAELEPKTEREPNSKWNDPPSHIPLPNPLHIPTRERHSFLLIYLPSHPSIFPSAPPTLLPIPPFLPSSTVYTRLTNFYPTSFLSFPIPYFPSSMVLNTVEFSLFLFASLSLSLSTIQTPFCKSSTLPRLRENRGFAYLRARAANERKVDEIVSRFIETLDDFSCQAENVCLWLATVYSLFKQVFLLSVAVFCGIW